jgi:alkyl sulfatase BDS1-like metallo-beta-lactamase superfamily hydrolase
MTLIEGETGWIVVDPLTSLENASTALAFANKQLGDRPVVAVIYTHSHIDHFGGVLGVLEPKDVTSGKVTLVAPKGFMEAATSENTIAGVAMRRRSDYMYGFRLPRSINGHIDAGLGKEPAQGGLGVIEPNRLISVTGQRLVLDGVEFIFQYVPESEAPAELTFYLPKQKAFCGAELVSRTLHNLYTLRGAQVRNAVLWSAYIDEALNLFSDSTVYFGSHHWPVWGNDAFLEFMKTHRDTYKFIHDQTVRWFNHGYTSEEIAERLELPASLSKSYYNRGYYGTLSHNAKAVYQYYLGWYDANPANLNPLPSSQSAERYVEMMGGAEQIMAKANEYYQQGEYRWLAELLNKLVFAEPKNKNAKSLLAQTYEQLAYQAESAPWRDNYLTAAYELRNGSQTEPMDNSIYRDVLYEADPSYMFDTLAVRINAEKAEGQELSIKVEFPEINSSTLLRVENSVLRHRESTAKDRVDATMQISWDLWVRMAVNEIGMKDVLLSKDFKVQGSRLKLLKFLSLLETPEGNFNIVTP